jgi:hypothetical protein
MQRRAEKEFQENLRNELYYQEGEEAAKDFQMRLKAERAAEEKRMEEDFKTKLMEKFAEDERLEQMNA